MATQSPKRGRPATVRPLILAKMLELEKGRATVAQLGIKPTYMQILVRGGFVKATKSTVKESEGRGRPSTVYSVTLKGRSAVAKLAA